MPTVRFLSKRARENLFRAACFQSRRALCATNREAAVALLVLGETRSRGRRRERSERGPYSLLSFPLKEKLSTKRLFERGGRTIPLDIWEKLLFAVFARTVRGPPRLYNEILPSNEPIFNVIFFLSTPGYSNDFVRRDRASLFEREGEKGKKTIVRVSNELPRSTETLGNFFEDPLLCNSFIVSSLLATRNEYHFFFFRGIFARHALIFTWKMCG